MYLLAALLLLISPLKTNSLTNMLLFWGYPTLNEESKWCIRSRVASFEDCMERCLGDGMCMLSYGNDTTCMLCDMYAISSITQIDSAGGIMIAVKVDGLDYCSVNIQDRDYTWTNGKNSYTMTYTGPSWTFTTPKTCPDSEWRMFARPIGPFCIKITRNGNTGITRNEAVGICQQTSDGWLAGFDAIGEYNYIYTTAKSLFPTPLNYDYLTVWISGLMKSSCIGSVSTDCAGLKAFSEFPHQTNFDMYSFPSTYPNMTRLAAGSGGYYQRCLQLTWSQDLTAFDGMVTNAACEYACNGAQQICAFSYACGVLAS